MRSCIDRRYPPDQRTPKAVWRGTNTDAKGYTNYTNFL
jgi:hypothetical protein